jgi:hypothetical protein
VAATEQFSAGIRSHDPFVVAPLCQPSGACVYIGGGHNLSAILSRVQCYDHKFCDF